MENRRFERFSVNLPVTFSKAFTGDPLTKEGTTLNLSMGGCLVRQNEPPLKGTHLYIRTYLGEILTWVKVEVAQVRWVQEDSFGLEFIQIEPDQENQLRQYMGSIKIEPT